MGRDLDEFTREGTAGWFFLALFFSTPAAAVLLLVRRRWLALLPLAGWIALILAWFLYYATDWFGPVSGGAVGLVILLLIGGWFVLGVAATFSSRGQSDPDRTGWQTWRSANRRS